MRKTGISMNIKGVVWDSCPGPYPEVTLIRLFTLILKKMLQESELDEINLNFQICCVHCSVSALLFERLD